MNGNEIKSIIIMSREPELQVKIRKTIDSWKKHVKVMQRAWRRIAKKLYLSKASTTKQV